MKSAVGGTALPGSAESSAPSPRVCMRCPHSRGRARGRVCQRIQHWLLNAFAGLSLAKAVTWAHGASGRRDSTTLSCAGNRTSDCHSQSPGSRQVGRGPTDYLCLRYFRSPGVKLCREWRWGLLWSQISEGLVFFLKPLPPKPVR